MTQRTVQIVGFIASGSFLLSGCTNDIQGEGAFANGGGSGMARAAGMNTAASFATGVPTDAITGHTVRVLAKYQATVRQRRVAEARARKAVSKLKARAQARPRAASSLSPSRQAAGAPPRQPIDRSRETASAPAKPAPIPRYIAVDTAPDERQSPRAEKSVMIWDTQAQEIVGNNIYDIQAAPSVGTAARFETYSAEYVGAGL